MADYERVIGRNAVKESLKADRNINKLFIMENHDKGLVDIIKIAKSRGINIQKTNRHKLDNMAGSPHHQGVIALCSPVKYVSVNDIIEVAYERDEKPFIIILDNVTDPHNAGAIVRSAYCAGAHGVVFAKRKSAGVGEGMYKSSAGAIEHIALAEVSNIAQTIDKLKKEGIFVVGLDMAGDDYREIDYDMSLAIVIGAEGKGLSRLVKEKCDFLASIPLRGDFDSLNASVAAGIVMFEALKDR